MHVETSAAVAVRGLYPVISSPAPVTSDSTLDCTSGGGEDQLWDIFSEHSLRYFIMNFSHTDLFYSRTFLTNLLLFFRTCSSQSSLNLMFWAERLQWSFHGKWRRKKNISRKFVHFTRITGLSLMDSMMYSAFVLCLGRRWQTARWNVRQRLTCGIYLERSSLLSTIVSSLSHFLSTHNQQLDHFTLQMVTIPIVGSHEMLDNQ